MERRCAAPPRRAINGARRLRRARRSSSFRAENSFSEPGLPDTPPTSEQLQNHFMICAVPMVGFGLMDNTVMIHAGNAIDSRSRNAWDYWAASRAPWTGCSLGLLNLFVVDTKQSSVLKLRHDAGEALGFTVDVDNGARHDATTVTIEGPDIEGLVASLTAAIANSSYSLVTCAASPGDDADSVRDVFVIQTASGDQVDDGHLDDLARATPRAGPAQRPRAQGGEPALQHKQLALLERVAKLEAALEEASIKKQGSSAPPLRRSGGLP
ncbi:hypothetical protein JL722_14684 [Aureococcus anophagefferens]|nr:hypothetical protein JL722_14684 [Aureococcus anophagefferens]